MRRFSSPLASLLRPLGGAVVARSLEEPRASVHGSAATPDKLLIGNPANGIIAPVHVSWTDIAGLDITNDRRLAAGKLLSMMDYCASRTSNKVTAEVTKKTGKKYLTATVSVTNTLFASPTLHGDAIRMDGRVVHCGSSALGIYIRFFRQSPSNRVETVVGESFFTMVAMTPDLRAAKILPAMELTDPFDIVMNHRYEAVRAIQKENDALWAQEHAKTLAVEDVDCSINAEKPSHVTIRSTRTEANRIFFSAYLNNNNTVFGGELMAWMEMHATHCARMFTGNRHIFTIGMHSVSFREPVFSSDWVTLHATVIYVRNTSMEVDVKITVERQGTPDVITNRASFVLINENEIGQKAHIPIGLDLKKATQEELHAFYEARWRYHRSVERRRNFDELTNEYSLMKAKP